MKDPAYDLATYYITKATGEVWGVNVFGGVQPTSPNACVTFINTGGYPRDEILNPEVGGLRYPTVMATIRGNQGDYKGAREKAEQVHDKLHKIMNFTANGNTYQVCMVEGEPNWLGFDENNRPLWSINFKLTV